MKITDIGFARADDPATAAGAKTLTGTLAYLARERIGGAPATPVRIDVPRQARTSRAPGRSAPGGGAAPGHGRPTSGETLHPDDEGRRPGRAAQRRVQCVPQTATPLSACWQAR